MRKIGFIGSHSIIEMIRQGHQLTLINKCCRPEILSPTDGNALKREYIIDLYDSEALLEKLKDEFNLEIVLHFNFPADAETKSVSTTVPFSVESLDEILTNFDMAVNQAILTVRNSEDYRYPPLPGHHAKVSDHAPKKQQTPDSFLYNISYQKELQGIGFSMSA